MSTFSFLATVVVSLSVSLADRDDHRTREQRNHRENRYSRRTRQRIEDCQYNSAITDISVFENNVPGPEESPQDIFNDIKNNGGLVTEYSDSGEQYLETLTDSDIYQVLSEELSYENEETAEENDPTRRLVLLGGGRSEITGNPITSQPQKWIGQVLFENATGTTFLCSGTLVCNKCGSDDRAYMLTAGHCVNDGEGNWYQNKRFYPRRNSDQTNISPIYTSQCHSFTGWTQNALADWDFALCKLQSTPNLGSNGFGYSTSLGTSDAFTITGYPGDQSFGSMWETKDDLSDTNDFALFTDDTDTVGGVSGGPWHRDSNEIIYGVHKGGLENVYNRATRINKYKYDWMCDKMVDRC